MRIGTPIACLLVLVALALLWWRDHSAVLYFRHSPTRMVPA